MTPDEILKTYEARRQRVECWTRVMGYFRPVSYFNEGKKSEFKARKWFNEPDLTLNALPQVLEKTHCR